MNFKVGDRVALYTAGGRHVGTIMRVDSADSCGVEVVSSARAGMYSAHYKQLRRLKPREKSVRVTRSRLAGYWDVIATTKQALLSSKCSDSFKMLCELLELDQ